MRRRSPFIAEPQEDAGRLATEVARLAWPLHRPADLERLIDRIGDARYTDMTDEGMFNVNQLVRQRHAAEGVFLVGFGSYRGSVIAAKDWEAPTERMQVPAAREGSWEDVLHRASPTNKLLLLRELRHRDEFAAIARSASFTTPNTNTTATMCRRCCRVVTTRSVTSTRPARCVHSSCTRP